MTLDRPRRAIYVYGTPEGTYRFIERDDGAYNMDEFDPINCRWEFLHVVSESSVKREVKAFIDNGYRVNAQNFGTAAAASGPQAATETTMVSPSSPATSSSGFVSWLRS